MSYQAYAQGKKIAQSLGGEPSVIMQSQKGVRTLHPQYLQYQDKWQRCRDAEEGEDAVKNAGVSYLPKLKKQPNEAYVAYLMRGSFYNATARTIDGLQGMIFRKPAIKDTPAAIDKYLTDVDMCGMPLEVFTQEVVEECLTVGRVGILVDHPQGVDTNGQPYTVDIAEKANMRPTLKTYCTENILNWKFKQINNAWTLCQVVLREWFTQPAIDETTKQPSEFEETGEYRYRVLDLLNDAVYRVRMFRIDETDSDQLVSTVIPIMNNLPLTFIPFIGVNENGTSFNIEDPPLLDLVNTNLSHWRVSCDYEHGCHFTALPTLFIAGYTSPVNEQGEAPEEIMLGSQSAICLSEASATAQFIEFTGQGLTAIENNLNRKEAQMAILGARMLATEGKNQQSTTTTAIHRTGENSVLSQISIGVSLGIQKALDWFSQWAGFVQECKYELNKDFLPVTVDGPTLTALFAGVQQAQINKEEMFDWLQRADVIDADISYDEHKAGDFVDPLAVIAAAHPPGAPDNPVGNSPIKANPEKP